MKEEAKIIIITSLMATFLGFGCNFQNVKASQTVAQGEEEVTEKGPETIYETSAWKEVENKWHNMDKVRVSDFGQVSEKVEKEKEAMGKYLDELVEDDYFSTVTGEAINYVYGENLRSSLEATVPLPCCYEPVASYEWDCTGIDTREGLKNKLALIEELYEKGTVEKEVLDKAKEGVVGRLELLEKADEYWEGKGDGSCEDHPEEVDILLHLYDINIGDIQGGKDVSPDLIIASEYIVELENE